MDLCSIVSSVLGLIQPLVNSFFGVFSFLGVQAPDLASLLNPLIGCTA